MRTTYTGTRPRALINDKYVQGTGRQVDWDYVPSRYRQGAVIVTAGALAAQNATTMTLTVPVGTTLGIGSVLYFGADGSGKFAKLTQPVVGTGAPVAGITVEPLLTQIASADTAGVGGTGPKFIPAMTVMAQNANGKVVPYVTATLTYSAASAAKGTNTGNGVLTLATPTVVTGGQVGKYRVVFVEPTTNLGTFIVEDPAGHEIGEGVVGTAFSNQIAFTIADGATDFISGDSFTITVTETDANTCAGMILSDATQNSLTDAASGYGMIVSGLVYENMLPDASGGPPATLSATLKAALLAMQGYGWMFETYVDTRS